MVGRIGQTPRVLLGSAEHEPRHSRRHPSALWQYESAVAGARLWRRALEPIERNPERNSARHSGVFSESVVKRRAGGSIDSAIDERWLRKYLVSQYEPNSQRYL